MALCRQGKDAAAKIAQRQTMEYGIEGYIQKKRCVIQNLKKECYVNNSQE